MIASLPMYLRPELLAPLSRYWDSLRDHLRDARFDAPYQLDHKMIGLEAWRRPDLLLSQTCGAPFRDHLHADVHLIGTPDPQLPSCPPGYYQSVFIARAELDWAKAAKSTWAANEKGSQSGYYAAKLRAGFPLTNPIWSGGHLASIEMVKSGRVEWAAIDAITWNIARRFDDLNAVLVWDRSPPSPGLPYITALGNDVQSLSSAVRSAIFDLEETDRNALQIFNLVAISKADYLNMPKPS
ncbi:MAG: PhnD/SsuA/transferrin family substrate-binding protein [Pseudomonadota bacterium]